LLTLCFCRLCCWIALKLGDVAHNVQSLDAAKAALAASQAAPAAAAAPVYAQAASTEIDEAEEDEDEDAPPPLDDEAQDERYMNGLD
jgi:hypothetical protein